MRQIRRLAKAITMLATIFTSGCMTADESPADERAIVIAHRGASSERPEHTLLAYRLAIEQGADFIEPDLVPTKDGVLVARHENNIADTTDVAGRPEFVDRTKMKTIDGVSVTGWFTEDFTLAELKTLRAKERLPHFRPGSARYDGQAEIPTLDEVIDLARRSSSASGRSIGIYPEVKHPGYFASIGLPLETKLVEALAAAGWDSADAPVFIQSFEVGSLQRLNRLTRVRLIQLLAPSSGPADVPGTNYAAMAKPEGLADVAHYADGIGVEKSMILPPGGVPSTLVADAHEAGLKVHAWTFRAENFFLSPDFRSEGGPGGHGLLADEISFFLAQGVDGLFTDHPYIGVTARSAFRAHASQR